jgi:hypothetical protein
MIVPHSAPALASPAAGLTIPAERLRVLMLWLTGACSAIVFIEPSPYELVSFLTILVFGVGGLVLTPRIMPLALLLVLINIGYSISAGPVIGETGVVAWVITSWYLAVTAIFFAAALGANTQARLDALARGCVIAGVIASIVAIIGYFRFFPSLNDTLLLYERARGTFKDPNVLGAFLIFPGLLALQRVITGRFGQALRGAALLALIGAAILLSFSRAAWGQIVYTSVIVLALTFVTTRSPSRRLRVVLLGVAGIAAVTLLAAALLSIESVANLFQERARLEQSYDMGAQGRFARHALGAVFALDRPLGIGPLQFSKYFPEDPHNSFLNAFMAGGWLAGACYPALVALSLAFGLRAALTPSPWQQTTITVFAAYVGVATESFIIDSDHWRHTFLLLGLLWGLMAVTQRHAARERAAEPVPMTPRRAALAR